MAKAIFLASIPDILSAIKIGGTGARVQFDVPETELANMLPLVAMKEQVLRVTVESLDCKTVGNNAIQTGPVRKSAWSPPEVAGADNAS